MRLAYWTMDEVHQNLAQKWADDIGVMLCPLSANEGPSRMDFDALICDWDYVPICSRRRLRDFLAEDRTGRPVVVHGYHIEDDLAEMLRGQGVAVIRYLQPEALWLACICSRLGIGPDADLPGFDITSYWARSGLLSMTRDAGAPLC